MYIHWHITNIFYMRATHTHTIQYVVSFDSRLQALAVDPFVATYTTSSTMPMSAKLTMTRGGWVLDMTTPVMQPKLSDIGTDIDSFSVDASGGIELRASNPDVSKTVVVKTKVDRAGVVTGTAHYVGLGKGKNKGNRAAPYVVPIGGKGK